MCRLTERTVRSTFVTAWFFAGWPTSTSPFLANATTDGVVREPSELAMTVGSPPSRTATTELVVPRSMPTARAISILPVCLPLSVLDSSLLREEFASQTRLERTPLNLSDRPTSGVRGLFPASAVVVDGHVAAAGLQVHRVRGTGVGGHVEVPLAARRLDA